MATLVSEFLKKILIELKTILIKNIYIFIYQSNVLNRQLVKEAD